MKKLTSLLLLLIIFATPAFSQFFQWAKKQETNLIPRGTSNLPVEGGTKIASGATIVATTGEFYQSITLGTQTFNSSQGGAYLAVYDHAGAILWAKQIQTPSGNQPSVTLDQNQNVIISGVYQDSLFIDNLLFKASKPSRAGIYLVKFSPTGSMLWSKSSNVTMGNYKKTWTGPESAVTTDAGGNVYLTGSFSDTIQFDGTSLINGYSGKDAYLTKYSASGRFLWAKKVGNSNIDISTVNVQTTSKGNIYLSCNIGNPFILIIGYEIWKLDSTGTAIWDKRYPSGSIMSVAVDDQENTYVAGVYDNINSAQTGGIFLVRLDASGNLTWTKTIANLNSQSQQQYKGIFWPPKIILSTSGQLAITGPFNGTIQFGNQSVTSPTASTNTYVAKLDTSGTTIWLNSIPATSPNKGDGITNDPQGNLFITGTFQGNASFSATALNTNATNTRYITKISNGANAVTGKVFLDMNSNGVMDASERPLGQQIVEVNPGPIYGISGPDGYYQIYLPAGNFNMSLPTTLPSFSAVPANYSLSFTGTNQIQTGKDFALQPVPGSIDLRIMVDAIAVARPGSSFKYQITYQNIGSITISDTIKFYYNTTSIVLNSTSVAPLSNANGIMTWYYQNLEPFEKRTIELTYSVPATAVPGTPLTAFATIGPLTNDLSPANNISMYNHAIVASFDPNDKQVDKPRFNLTQAANSEYLDYTIRFQNTGTDTAFTVIVTDKISTKLNLANFEMLSASHPYKVSLNNQTLEWRFDNILLPDSGRNELASHGFIHFRIKSKPGLASIDSIANQAAIYFDFNAPVITNFAVTKVYNPLAGQEPKAKLQPFQLYPNPAQNYVMVAAELKKPSAATIRLVNVLGQVISEVTLPANNQIHYQLPLNNFPKGVYLVQLETENGRQTQRLVVQ